MVVYQFLVCTFESTEFCNTNERLSMFLLGASWFHSDELEIDRTATMVPRRDPIKVTKVFQVGDNNTVNR